MSREATYLMMFSRFANCGMTLAWLLAAWVVVVCLFASDPVQSQETELRFDPNATAPPEPDYGQSSNWAAKADNEGAAAAVPEGATARLQDRQVDVFYVHPTTDRSEDYWNAPVDDAAINAWTDGSVIARQAGIFNACCHVFAPRYRQATLATSKAGGAVRDEALALAYGDVRRAFEHYLEEMNVDRPFILVGHSQGAAHIERLLRELIDGQPLSRRLVAAYIVGIGFPAAGFDLPGSTMSVCRQPDSTGCAVHWNSNLASADTDKLVAVIENHGRERLPAGMDPAPLCINPLTFAMNRPIATRAASKGAVPGAPSAEPLDAIISGSVAAYCENGLLIVDPDPALNLEPLPGGSMHYHDLGLFYEDVRQNALLRTRTFLNNFEDAQALADCTDVTK